ncbi:phage baseplate assembly protein [Bradyrhizobium septentrionale]|uniref:Bacteriophage Mu Gp45 N-terminal domain-containing protein n=1 Tax=Bradyrhizobium septentrionale TaxID=1404411 RepID=A0A973W050_9BRAD|nr:phage baseplate assembly protein [Bradyrhizobium septentrionale]UGY13734.1 phage baseplate assembly protein [Bradyrhizobium septentrionale]
MRFGTPIETSFRSFMTVFRATVNSVADKHMMQETDIDGFHSHKRKNIEAPQNYGFSSVVMPRDGKQGQGGGYGNDDIGGEAAEAIMLSAGGMSHYIAVMMDDRRHRPRTMVPGSSAQYGPNTDYGRSLTYIKPSSKDDKDGGVFMIVPHPDEYVSMRHINNKKQPKPKAQQPGQQGGSPAPQARDILHVATTADADGGQQEQDYNHHKGDGINTEIRCTKDRIEFRVGDTVVGYYDKGNSRWSFTGEMRLGDDNASHPVYGVNGGKGMTTKTSGSGAVLVTAPQPGPATSQDVNP